MPFLFRSREFHGEPLNVLGDSQCILLGGEDTDNKFTLIDQENPPGFEVPLNLHEAHDETNIIISGEVTFTVDTKSILLKQGSCLHIPRGSAHRFRVTGLTPARMLLIFHPSGLENLFRDLMRLFPAGVPLDIDRLNQVAAPYKTKILAL